MRWNVSWIVLNSLPLKEYSSDYNILILVASVGPINTSETRFGFQRFTCACAPVASFNAPSTFSVSKNKAFSPWPISGLLIITTNWWTPIQHAGFSILRSRRLRSRACCGAWSQGVDALGLPGLTMICICLFGDPILWRLWSSLNLLSSRWLGNCQFVIERVPLP